MTTMIESIAEALKKLQIVGKRDLNGIGITASRSVYRVKKREI
jgi:hypothetical protein